MIAVSFRTEAGIAGGGSRGGSGSVAAGVGACPITRPANPDTKAVSSATVNTIERIRAPSSRKFQLSGTIGR